MFNKLAFAAILALSAAAANADTNLVVNGDFETGNFTGWTKSGNTSLSDVIANTTTSNHTFLWRNGATGSPAFISQSITTTPGSFYELAFDVFNSATTNQTFSVDFGATQVYAFANEVHNWTHHVFSVEASSALTVLTFGGRNDPSFTRLDNVVLTASAVPEPEGVALLMAGLGVLAFVARQRKQA